MALFSLSLSTLITIASVQLKIPINLALDQTTVMLGATCTCESLISSDRGGKGDCRDNYGEMPGVR